MPFKCFIFDLDGTLVDTVKDLAEACNHMRRSLDLPEVTVEEMARLIGNGMRDVIVQSFKNINAPADDQQIDHAVKIMRDYYLEHTVVHTCAYEGVADTLAYLKNANCKLAVVTNKYTSATLNILKTLELDGYFDCILGNGEGFPLKPDPALLFEAARRTDSPLTDCVMIGDNHTDLRAAGRAGIASVFVRYGYGCTDGEKPDIFIDKFSELKALI